MLGRRGPAQAAFTNPELLELAELTEADVLRGSRATSSSTSSSQLDRGRGRADPPPQRRDPHRVLAAASATAGRSRIALRFLVSPVAIQGEDKVEAIEVVRNELYRDADGTLRARATEQHETIECGLVLRSIGYRGVPLPGRPLRRAHAEIPNDERRSRDPHRPGVRAGRVLRSAGSSAARRRDRHQQAATPRRPRTSCRGPARGPAERARRPPAARPLEALIAERKPDASPTPAGRRSTPPRRRRRAAGPPAREALHLRGAARSGEAARLAPGAGASARSYPRRRGRCRSTKGQPGLPAYDRGCVRPAGRRGAPSRATSTR